jgi:serine protease Do
MAVTRIRREKMISYTVKKAVLAIVAVLASAVCPIVQGQQATVPKSPAAILKENDSALALIVSADDNSTSLGSGFFIGDGSAVVTNFHVISGAKKVVLKSGTGQVLTAEAVYAFDEKKDLAILRVTGASGAHVVALGDSDKVAIGESIVVVGNPEGFEKSVTNGLVSGLRSLDDQKLFQISAPISHGSSGGPVFNDRGQVIGVVVAFWKDGQNLNFAIPINRVSEMWIARKETSLASLPVPIEAAIQPLDIEGSWAATFADSASSGQLSFTMMQDGTSVRGTYTSSMGGGGTITGSVVNSKFSFELTPSAKDCPGKFVGNAALRSNSMIGSYYGNDCQGPHTNGSVSMTKGLAPIQVSSSGAGTTAAATSATQPIVQYGISSELKGVKTVFIYGVEPGVRLNMLKQFQKHPGLQVVGEMERADIVLVFDAQTFYRGTHTNVWTDSNGNGWATTSPRYGMNGEGSAVKLIPPNTFRVVWQFSTTRVSAFQRRPSTNFIRDFVAAWEKANQ